jgi:hypothetical protein
MRVKMKARPILMSTPMVQATLEGRKTQTRRIMQIQPTRNDNAGLWHIADSTDSKAKGKYHWGSKNVLEGAAEWFDTKKFSIPYGQVGDLLWIRERFCLGSIEAGDHYPESPEPLFVEQCEKENVIPYEYCIRNNIGIEEVKWKPSIFMPKWASRVTLEITNIRVERLQDISHEDSRAEGSPIPTSAYTIKDSYRMLWKSINGKDSWDKNPWVWVIEFKVHKCNYMELIK